MLKRLSLALAGLFALVSVAYGAGTVPGFSLTPQFDTLGKVAPGCKLYVIQAGTTSTPQNPYQDSGLTILAPNPLVCDATGRLPQFFVADGTIKLRLTTSTGSQLFVGDNLLVVGASSGGGGGGTVDPTTILQPCDMKPVYGTGVLSGFVRMNGRTIGNAVSGATERANADTLAAFTCLYNSDPNLAVSGGRGASAAADYAAGKTIATPDFRGRALAFMDDMGNSAAGRLTATYFGTAGTTLGAAGGNEKVTLVAGQIPSITSNNGAQSITVTAGGNIPVANSGWSQNATGSGPNTGPFTSGSIGNQVAAITGSNSISVTSNNTGSTPTVTVQPTMLATIYLKL